MKSDKLERIEERITFFKKDKDSDALKTLDEVFDRSTLLSIAKLFSKRLLDTLEYPISTGKEGNVFMALGSEGGPLAVKIYRTSTSTYKNIAKYIAGDPRFKGVEKKSRKLIYMWAQKEFRNLERMRHAGVSVPRPVYCLKNILVMEYIGTEEAPAPMLKSVLLEKPERMYEEVLDNLMKIYKDAKLVHGDLSEYNILVHDGKPVIIDVGQAVTADHQMAEEYLVRDVGNIARYFGKLGVGCSADEVLAKLREK